MHVETPLHLITSPEVEARMLFNARRSTRETSRIQLPDDHSEDVSMEQMQKKIEISSVADTLLHQVQTGEAICFINVDELGIDLAASGMQDVWAQIAEYIIVGRVLGADRRHDECVRRISRMWNNWNASMTFSICEVSRPIFRQLILLDNRNVKALTYAYETLADRMYNATITAALEGASPFTICSDPAHVNATMKVMLDINRQYGQQMNLPGPFKFICQPHVQREPGFLTPEEQKHEIALQAETKRKNKKRAARHRSRLRKQTLAGNVIPVDTAMPDAPVVVPVVHFIPPVVAADEGGLELADEGSELGEVGEVGEAGELGDPNDLADNEITGAAQPSKCARRHQRQVLARLAAQEKRDLIEHNKLRPYDRCDEKTCNRAAAFKCHECYVHCCARCYIRATASQCSCGASFARRTLAIIMTDFEMTWAEVSLDRTQCCRCFQRAPAVELAHFPRKSGEKMLMLTICLDCAVFRQTMGALADIITKRTGRMIPAALAYLTSSSRRKIMC